MLRRRRALRRERDQRGAVMIFVALLITVIVIVAALAVDIGVQRVARADMQSLADVVALDLARELDGRDVTALNAAGVATDGAQADASRDRNAEVIGFDPDDPPSLGVELGSFDPVSQQFTPMTAGVPSAVRVTASTSVDFVFGGITDVGSGAATRQAVATSGEPSVCFSVGTRTLTLDTSGSGLSPVLDHILRVNLSAVGYSGIADLRGAFVPLADLLVELNVGSYSELLTTNVALADFMIAAANALEANGDTAGAAVLRAITLGVGGIPVALGDILALETGADTAGLTVDVNVLDLLGAAIVAANGDHAVTATVPGVAKVSIIEPPQVACGRAGVEAYSAQVRVEVDTSVPGDATLGVVDAHVDLGLDIGRGLARLDAIGCSPVTTDVTVTTGAVGLLPPAPPAKGQVAATVTTDKVLDLLGPVNRLLLRPILLALGLSRIDLEALVAISAGTTVESHTIAFPEGTGLPGRLVVPTDGMDHSLDLFLPPGAVTLTSTGLVGALGDLLTPVLGALLSGVVDPLVNDVVDPLLTGLLNPVFSLLGIKLGVAEVDMLGRPMCEAVRLAA